MNEDFYYKSPIGILLVKHTGNAIASVGFTCKDGSGTVHGNNKPGVKSIPEIIQQCTDQLDKYFSGQLFTFNLLLDQQGTGFQQQVWHELLQIPYGRTESYLSLSRRIGNVKAIRAVGTANGKNNIAIIVPCHRVIGSDGSLTGYAGELWRKRWLLDHEAKHAHGVQSLF